MQNIHKNIKCHTHTVSRNGNKNDLNAGALAKTRKSVNVVLA